MALREVQPSDLIKIELLATLLKLFNRRNKNQHRRSIWWRHFSGFRRHLIHIWINYHHLNKVPTTHLERTRKATKDVITRTQLNGRIALWQEHLVPRWHHAYSQLVADQQFAVLGVTLLGALAEACQILGITETFEELGQVEVEKAIEEFGEEYWKDEDGGEDRGVVVKREEV
ncbi:Ribonuclease MRP protein subunit rmp1 [Extremus antarcticus]|uniref:Ribonuclease MRP protein subunit rmp1 n=1 Tax=Extremus antarcticus TaxID=702011 RepID=A0AAJ0DGX8_9PEZI|nr:Ribonuclease MRP protein subunit rmp1 [Extremus antarcticus]